MHENSRPMSSIRGWTASLTVVLSLGACEEKSASQPSTLGRSDAVLAKEGAPRAVVKPEKPAAQVEAKETPRSEPLCDSRPMTDFPKARLTGLDQAGLDLGAASPARGLTWVNLWAAWCEPCKREIPLILEFQKKLKAQGVPLEVAFISLDDDQRQLEKFLSQSGFAGFTKSYWLREGKEREEWLAEAGLRGEPRLPVHFLVSGSQKTFCRIEGSVTAGDLPALEAQFREQG